MADAGWIQEEAALSLERLWPWLEAEFQEVSPTSREWQEFERRLRGEWERLFGLLVQLYGQNRFRSYGMGYRFTDLVSGSRYSANGPLSLDPYQFVWLEGDAGQDSQ
ncbi:MAG TPA: hypothetical protein VF707_20370 [Ardenticatenaceae bacterium]|jgi:hypothetical protein